MRSTEGKMRSNRWPQWMKLGGIVALAGALMSLIGSCSREGEQRQQSQYEKQLQMCRDEMAKNPLVPIIGGGHLDTRRFSFNVPAVRVEGGQCGTDGFQTSFYWTGEKIVPASKRFTGVPEGSAPKGWRRLEVAAGLGNQRKGHECKANPDPQKCPWLNHKNPTLPPIWPQDFVVKPKAYPGLEIWIPKNGYQKNVDSINFVMVGWLKKDDSPRSVNCWHLPGYVPSSMTKIELENLDFGQQTMPCQVESWDFNCKRSMNPVLERAPVP